MTTEERMARATVLADQHDELLAGTRNRCPASETSDILLGLVHDLREARRELADLRAQVIGALSAAGPGEDERTA